MPVRVLRGGGKTKLKTNITAKVTLGQKLTVRLDVDQTAQSLEMRPGEVVECDGVLEERRKLENVGRGHVASRFVLHHGKG